jgi:hypothetical protein
LATTTSIVRGTRARSIGRVTGRLLAAMPVISPGRGEVPRKKTPATVAAAVDRDLAQIAKLDKALAESALAASAQALAREIDDPDNSATSKSMCARALLDALAQLREQLPEPDEKDKLDELSARRTARIAGRAKA